MGFDPRYDQRLIIGFAIAAGILLCYGIFPHIGKTFDSFLYLDAAEKLTTEGLYHKTFDSFPPLYPVILFLLDTNLIMVSIFNIMCWGLFQFLMLSISLPQIEDRFVKVCFAVTILFGTPIFLVHNFVWAEPPYLVLIALSLWIIQQSEDRVGSLPLILIGVVSLKYIGIAAVLAFGFVKFHKAGWKEALKLTLPPMFAFVLLQIHTFLLRSDLSRMELTEDLDLVSNVVTMGQEVGHWFYPWPIHWTIGFVISLVVLALSIWSWLKSDGALKYGYTLVVAFYLIVLFKGDLIIDDVERYLAPVYPFFIFLTFSLFKERLRISLLYQAIVAAITLYTILRTVRNCLQWHDLA